MNQSGFKYKCISRCPYRREKSDVCNVGAIQIPVEDGRQCLYPGERERRNLEIAQSVNFKDVAAYKWNPKKIRSLPAPKQIERILKFIDLP